MIMRDALRGSHFARRRSLQFPRPRHLLPYLPRTRSKAEGGLISIALHSLARYARARVEQKEVIKPVSKRESSFFRDDTGKPCNLVSYKAAASLKETQAEC